MQLSKLEGRELNKFKEFFLSCDFSDEQVDKIINNKNLILYDSNVIMHNAGINYIYLLTKLRKENGANPEKIRKMMTYNTKLLVLPKEDLDNNWQKLLNISISDDITSVDRNDNPNFLHFSEYDIIKMVYNESYVLCTDINEISKRISYLKGFGYTKENIMYMAVNAPTVLIQDYEKIKDRISYLASLKYSKAEILIITSKFPSLFEYGFEALDDRFFLIEFLNLHDVLVERPYILKQSPRLTYARYMFFQENGISIKKNNRKLFLQDKLFEKFYHIKKEELLNNPKYDYQIFQNEKAKIMIKKKKY